MRQGASFGLGKIIRYGRNLNVMKYLVVIETQKVKSYLFASPFLRETRGASIRLDLLNRKYTVEALKKFDPGQYQKVYLGGGSGRVLFQEKTHAECFRNTILELYRNKTVTGQVAVEIVDREENEAGPENFAFWVGRGVRECQKNKLGRIEWLSSLAGRWIRPCSSCGQEPAERMLTEWGEHHLCQSCLIKRKEVNELYLKIRPGLIDERILEKSSILKTRYTGESIFSTLADYIEAEKRRIRLPQEFEELGNVSRPANYMGFIYADGNRMGEVVKHLGDKFPADADAMQAYAAFSEISDQATREAAVEAVLAEVKIRKIPDVPPEIQAQIGTAELCYLPAEFILAGGDDLMLVVPVQHALPTAALFLEKFQEKTRQLQEEYVADGRLSKVFAGPGLTASAGVVLAHTSYPVCDLMNLAGELMKLAKKKAARLATQGEAIGTLDFMVVSEASSEPVKDRRRAEYSLGKKVQRTERPYTTAETWELLKTIRQFQESQVPRTKLKALYPVLFLNPMQSQFEALRLKERLKTTGDLEAGSPLGDLINGQLRRFPFRENPDNTWSTPLTELIELYDFVQPEPEAPGPGAEAAIASGG